MLIKNIERVLNQLVQINEHKAGKINFKIHDDKVETEDFLKADGFLPLLVIVAQSLETMVGGKKWSEDIFDIQDSETGLLHKEVFLKDNIPSTTPLHTVLMTLSASVDMLLDANRNPYISKDTETFERTVDLVAMLADMSQLTVSISTKAFSISNEVLEKLYEKPEELEENQLMNNK